MKVSWLLEQLRARKPRAQRAGYSGALCGEVKPGWGSTPLLSEKKLLKSHTELPLCVWGCVFVCVCEMQGEGISLLRSVWIAGVQWVHPHCGRKDCSGCARACVCVWACECVSDIRAPHCNTAKKIYHTFTESLAANTSRHVPLCYLWGPSWKKGTL